MRRSRSSHLANYFLPAVSVLAGVAVGVSGDDSAFAIFVGDSLSYFMPMILAFGMCVAVYRRVRFSRAERGIWLLLGAAIASLFVAEARFTAYSVATQGRLLPMEDPARVFIALSALFAIWAVLRWVEPEAHIPMPRIAMSTEVLIGACTVWLLTYLLHTVGYAQTHAYTSVVALAVYTAYPAMGFILITTTMMVTLGLHKNPTHAWERMLAGALTLYGLNLMFPLWPSVAQRADAHLSIFTVMSGLVLYLIAFAAMLRFRDAGAEPISVNWKPPSIVPRWFSGSMGIGASVVLPLSAFRASMLESEIRVPAVVGVALLGLLLVIRSVLRTIQRSRSLRASAVDPLTGVYSHVELDNVLAKRLKSSASTGSPLSIVVIDIDDPHHLRDVYGPEATEAAIQRLVEGLRSLAGGDTDVFRLVSDEFAVVLQGMDADAALEFADRARRLAIEDHLPEMIPIEVSMGIASYPQHATDGDRLLARAEIARTEARWVHPGETLVYTPEVEQSLEDRLESSESSPAARVVIRALADAVDRRVRHSREHSHNVCDLAVTLGEVMDIAPQQLEELRLAALVHDIGKIAIPTRVLEKTQPLTEQDWLAIRQHPATGQRILHKAHLLEVLPTVRHHHERWDGSGYPDGLAGEAIPIHSRILAVCDSFDAMTTDRPYRAAISPEDTLQQIEDDAGFAFDPEIASTFVRMVRLMLES